MIVVDNQELNLDHRWILSKKDLHFHRVQILFYNNQNLKKNNNNNFVVRDQKKRREHQINIFKMEIINTNF